MNNAEILAKVTGSTGVTVINEYRRSDGTLIVESVETAENFNMIDAWKFVAESYGDYSPNRHEWSKSDILSFVAEHHIDGLEVYRI
jgi:hypothetical protein